MMERFRFSNPLSKDERPKVTNKNFWWTENNNDSMTEETLNVKTGDNENLEDDSSEKFLLSESYEKYMESESKDIAKLHEKLNKLRMQLHHNLNEVEGENDISQKVVAGDSFNFVENSNSSDDESTSSSTEIMLPITDTKSHLPILNNQRVDKLPSNRSAKNTRENNFNIESLDMKAKNLIDRR
jgi:hypothetical protein